MEHVVPMERRGEVAAVCMARSILALFMCVACQGQGQGISAGSGTGSASGVPASPADAGAVADSTKATGDFGGSDAHDKPAESEPSEPPEPGRIIAELGAIPAWQAVVDRAQLLGRRGQHGVVYGRVGPAVLLLAPMPVAPAAPAGPATSRTPAPGAARAGNLNAGSDAAHGPPAVPASPAPRVPSDAPPGPAGAASPDAGAVPGAVDAGLVTSPYVWLIDDTEGNGSLGIRIALGDKAREGDRIAAGGAWQLDADRRWFWKPDSVQSLPPAPASERKDPQPPVPSHAIASGELPSGARTISVARDGDAVYFQIVGPAPASEGDGWQIADQLGSPVVAVLNLPGDRPSYGGQDMRSPDERWQLRRGQTYWVRIGKLRKRFADKPALVSARTAPIRVP
ncbi:MAG TPA: hypothetical protein VHN14_16385 [Kofleriaceae bacterium]|jgi:hypothetical protein|nr:hypothetical protein [Kofleriaceae bacterium]